MKFLISIYLVAAVACSSFCIAEDVPHATGQQYVSINSWVTAEQYKILKSIGIDLEESNRLFAGNSRAALFDYPTTLAYQTETLAAIALINKPLLTASLVDLSNFNTRNYRSPTGVASASWIFDRVFNIANNNKANLEVSRYAHAGWDQFSVIARFPGQDSSLPILIIGAHQDTVAGAVENRSPGADDDGSGTTTLIELIRILAEKQFNPVRPVEFHWYSGEEAGLLGSKAISLAYKTAGVQVYAMLNIDMDSYTGIQNVFGVMTDYTDVGLTTFLRLVAREYGSIPLVDTRCGYACSDHAPWSSVGYPAGFLAEAEFSKSNPNIHTARDTVDFVDYDHMIEYVKVGLAFFFELGYAA